MPERQTLSIFCDELDRRIQLYDDGAIDSDEGIQDALANLEEILDENVDLGVEPGEAFSSISEYLAEDVESFIYDYIAEQIDTGYGVYAYELLEGFYPYMSDLKWFDFLRARLAATENIEDANSILERVLDDLEDEPNIDLQLEVLRYMAKMGDRSPFVALAKQTLPLIQVERDFQDILEIVSEYYHRFDQEELEIKIGKIMKKREEMPSLSEISSEDPDVYHFVDVLES